MSRRIYRGRIKTFCPVCGNGTISTDKDEILFHASDFTAGYSPLIGDRVECRAENFDDQLVASEVMLVELGGRKPIKINLLK